MFCPRPAGDLPLNTSPVPSHLSSLWSLALPSIKNVVKPFTTAASFLYCWCQNTVAQVSFLLLYFCQCVWLFLALRCRIYSHI